MSQQGSDGAEVQRPDPDGRPIALESTAESADPTLPAFLAPPPGAPGACARFLGSPLESTLILAT